MRTGVDVTVAALLLVWLLATVAGQFGRRSRWIRQGWLSWCLPEWRLFAPEPADWDYHLIYRTIAVSGAMSSFALVQQYPPSRFRAFWNPAGRQQKMRRDVILALLNECQGGENAVEARRRAQAASQMIPYRLLLGLTVSACAQDDGCIQFAVLKETPGDSLDLVFLSTWHELAAGTG